MPIYLVHTFDGKQLTLLALEESDPILTRTDLMSVDNFSLEVNGVEEKALAYITPEARSVQSAISLPQTKEPDWQNDPSYFWAIQRQKARMK